MFVMTYDKSSSTVRFKHLFMFVNGHCSLRSIRNVCWRRINQINTVEFCGIMFVVKYEVNHLHGFVTCDTMGNNLVEEEIFSMMYLPTT